MSRKVFSFPVVLHATIYAKGETPEAAAAAAVAACLDAGLELSTRSSGDLEISGLQFEDPDLPEVSLSPAVTVGAVETGSPEEMGEADQDDDEGEPPADPVPAAPPAFNPADVLALKVLGYVVGKYEDGWAYVTPSGDRSLKAHATQAAAWIAALRHSRPGLGFPPEHSAPSLPADFMAWRAALDPHVRASFTTRALQAHFAAGTDPQAEIDRYNRKPAAFALSPFLKAARDRQEAAEAQGYHFTPIGPDVRLFPVTAPDGSVSPAYPFNVDSFFAAEVHAETGAWPEVDDANLPTEAEDPADADDADGGLAY